MLAHASYGSEGWRDTNASYGVIQGGNFAQHCAAVKKIRMVETGDQRNAVRCQVLVVQSPSPFHVNQCLSCAIPSGKIPRIFCVDSVGGGIKITLIAAAWIIRSVYKWWLDWRRLDINRCDRIPLR